MMIDERQCDEVTTVAATERTVASATSFEKVVAVEVKCDNARDDVPNVSAEEQAVFKTTFEDARDMQRMGKSQQLVRNFRLLSATAFVAIATAAWELGIILITPGLQNGGTAGLLYSTLWNFIGSAPIYLSMAEMVSMAPIAGSQYHWMSEFAPEKYQRILSYLTGWTSTMALQAGNALGIFLTGTLVQVIITIANPDYAAPAWHATLLVIGCLVLTYAGNVYGNHVLPYWQTPVFTLHILAYFFVIVPIWVNAPRAPSQQVWTDFSSSGGWSGLGLTILVGQLTGISNQVGLDTVAHMSEEVKNAARPVPISMMVVFIINFVLIFVATITLCHHIPDIDAALNDPSLYPAVYVLRQSMSSECLIALLSVTHFILIASNIVYLAAVTRDLFAFARDRGLPFSIWLEKVDKQRHVPRNACASTCLITIALSLVYLGSPTAFYAITSLSTCALLQCYSLSIGCCLWRRVNHPETMPPTQFSLGRMGIPVNIMAVIYSGWSFFWSFWPLSYPVMASDFNWASVIFVSVLLGSMVYFFLRAQYVYNGPVVDVLGRDSMRDGR